MDNIEDDLRKMLHEDFKKNLNLNRYLGIEETKAEEVKEVEETEKMKPSIEEKQNDTVVSLQKQEKPTDDAELSPKSNHQQPPVQMTLFDLWGMEEGNRQTVHFTKKKAEVTVGAAAKKVSRKKASPLVKSVNPTFEVVTKPVEKEEKPSLTDTKEQETAQETKPILPGDEPYASISCEENPPINGFYEMMMTMAPEDRVLLRQKAELHRQEQLKALGVEDTLDPKFKPPMEPIEVLKAQIGHGHSKGNEPKEDSKTQNTLKETNHEREQQKEQERKREELAKKKEDAMKPRPFDEKLESFHREGSMVLDSARTIGVLKDLTKYGATFMPLDLNMEQKEKNKEEYYVYAMGKLWGIYENAAEAIQTADTNAGVVLNRAQQYVWERGNTADKAMLALGDIPDAVKKAPLSADELEQEIQKQGQAVDMTGCTLSQILYQTGAQRPVIVKGEGGASKVIVGFDGYNTYLYDPSSQTTAPMGMNDSTKAFEENGNVFICYMEKINE